MKSCCDSPIQTTSLKTKEQFDSVLNLRAQIRNNYFVLHYNISRSNHLSTDAECNNKLPVDKCHLEQSRLGLIIPKRWAKHAVTRTLIKRQCRAQFVEFANTLPAGDWVIRLRRTFDPSVWKSSASPLLKEQVRKELQHLFNKMIKQLKVEHSNVA